MNFQPGDTVEFVGKRGRIQGVIARIRVKERRKAQQLINQMFMSTQDRDMAMDLTMQYVAEIPSDSGLWTVPFNMLRLVKRGGQEDESAAKHRVAAFMSQRANVADDNVEKARSLGLNPGDKVMVRFKEGSRPRVYVKMSASGRLLVKNDYGREQWVWPGSVTKI